MRERLPVTTTEFSAEAQPSVVLVDGSGPANPWLIDRRLLSQQSDRLEPGFSPGHLASHWARELQIFVHGFMCSSGLLLVIGLVDGTLMGSRS